MSIISDPLGRAFIEFFQSEGFHFVDAETGETLFEEEDEHN